MSRSNEGRFLPGFSGNPGGRPQVMRGVRELAQQYASDAVETLAQLMSSPDTPPAARIAACEALLNRGFGKPVDQKVMVALSHQIDRPMNARDLSTRDIIDLIVERSPGLLE